MHVQTPAAVSTATVRDITGVTWWPSLSRPHLSCGVIFPCSRPCSANQGVPFECLPMPVCLLLRDTPISQRLLTFSASTQRDPSRFFFQYSSPGSGPSPLEIAIIPIISTVPNTSISYPGFSPCGPKASFPGPSPMGPRFCRSQRAEHFSLNPNP